MDEDTDADLAELQELRAGLRAFGKKLALHVQDMKMPETPLEAERTARMVRAADQMLIQIYAPPVLTPPRYARPGSGGNRTYDEVEDVSEHEDSDEKVLDLIRKLTRAHARMTGFWPNGHAFDAADSEWQADADANFQPVDDASTNDSSVGALQAELVRRFNIQTRLHAEQSGAWPDGSPCAPSDANSWDDFGPDDWPGYWSVSTNARLGQFGPADGELRGPNYLPNWVVRRPPKSQKDAP